MDRMNQDRTAFPHHVTLSDSKVAASMGLTKLEYFTAAAMQGIIASGVHRDKAECDIAYLAIVAAKEALAALEAEQT